MGSPAARRINPDDYSFIRAVLRSTVTKLKATNRKVMYRYLDVDVAMSSIYEFEHAYIVADSFLVIYSVEAPWYSNDLFLHERLVLRLMKSAPFGVVTQFLTSAAVEAGAVLAAAGTALAKSDAALASLYIKDGFSPEGLTLVKEI